MINESMSVTELHEELAKSQAELDHLRQDNERLKGEVDLVNGFREQLRQKFNRKCDTLREAMAIIESLYADLQRHKSCLEVARRALRECVDWAEDHFAGSSCKFEQPAQLALHQINEVLGGDSAKTTEK